VVNHDRQEALAQFGSSYSGIRRAFRPAFVTIPFPRSRVSDGVVKARSAYV